MDEQCSLNNHFLIAMPHLGDPNFFHTVTYLCEHTEKGAMGLVINRPLDITLTDIFEQMSIETKADEFDHIPVFMGGPVEQERGFVLHQPAGDWEASQTVTEQVAITSSRDILEAIARHEGPDQFVIVLGYAGWGSGQLEQELADNAWLNGPAQSDILFSTPIEQRWEAAAALFGIDLNLISTQTGHA